MGSHTPPKIIALIVVPLVVGLLLTAFSLLGHLVATAVGLPGQLGMPLALRLGGLLFLVAGSGVLVWVFRYRSPITILFSTFATMAKTVQRVPPHEPGQRSEALVVRGPHRYVRHPLYSAVMLLVIGWWLLLDRSFLLFGGLFLLLWFNFVVAPFEERELKALFGADYESYARETPRFVPFLRRRSIKDDDR